MANNRAPLEVFQTGIGTLVYPWLNEPDVRYNKTGVYQCRVQLPFADAQDLIAQAERVRDEYFAKLDPQKSVRYAKKPVYEVVFTQPPANATEEEKQAFVPEPTDLVEFKCKLNALVTPKDKDPFTQSVILVDLDGQAVTDQIWTGTKARVKGQICPWMNAAQQQVGVTFRVKSVQVHELVTGTGSKWGDFGD